MSADRALAHERRVLRLATFYAPLAAGGAWLSLRYGVAAHAGGDPARDLALRGTGLARRCFCRPYCLPRLCSPDVAIAWVGRVAEVLATSGSAVTQQCVCQ
jgi:hypothetical protein